MGPTVIEIHTIEGGRTHWAAIFRSTKRESALEWGSALLRGVPFSPKIRMTDGLYGPVVGQWINGRFEPFAELGRTP